MEYRKSSTRHFTVWVHDLEKKKGKYNSQNIKIVLYWNLKKDDLYLPVRLREIFINSLFGKPDESFE